MSMDQFQCLVILHDIIVKIACRIGAILNFIVSINRYITLQLLSIAVDFSQNSNVYFSRHTLPYSLPIISSVDM